MTTVPDKLDQVDVSVLVPVLNEAPHIRATVARMQSQRFDGTLELLFADGGSDDGTREILQEIAEADQRVRVLDNRRRRTASGLNVCLRAARGRYVARMDAHTFYSERYLAAGVERLLMGGTEWVSGPAVPRAVGPVSRSVQLALASWLGRGASRKWSGESSSDGGEPGGARESELDTGVFGGVWRRNALMAVGGWDERWPVNQDSEMAARFLERGGRLVCLPEMVGHYVPRDSLSRLARQYFRYGYYRAQTFRRHPASMRRSHLAAPALVCTLAAASIGPRPLRTLARAGAGAYAAAVAAATVNVASRRGTGAEVALFPIVVPVMHVSWGAGAIAGMVRFGLPVAALMRLTGSRGGSVATTQAREPVYAPSLHGR